MSIKINSKTNKEYSYSSVIYNNGSLKKYLEKLYNSSLGVTQLQEYNLIEKYHNFYKKPRKMLNMTIEKIHPCLHKDGRVERKLSTTAAFLILKKSY